MVDVETLDVNAIISCEFCGGEWLNEDKFQKHLTMCAHNRTTMAKRQDLVMTLDDLILEETEKVERQADAELFTCITCYKVCVNEKEFNKHVKSCLNTKQHAARNTKVTRSTGEDIEQNTTEELQEETNETVKYSARGRKISQQTLYQVARTTHRNRPQINTPTEELPSTSKTTGIDDEVSLGEVEKDSEKRIPADKEDYLDDDDNRVFFECEKCLQMFVNEEKFTNHTCQSVKTELSSIKYPCRFCIQGFKTTKALECHLQKYHADRSFTCDHCFSVFTQRTRYKYHMEMHTNKNAAISFECTSCNMVFYTEVQLKCHENDKHKMHHFPHVCETCGKAFRKATNLEYHYFSHSPSSKPFKCDKCPATFGRRKMFDVHMETHMNQERGTSEICLICGKDYLNATSLRNHVRFVHKVADQMCEVCGKVFKNAEHLKRHRHIHDVVKPYKCVDCGKEFAEVSNLRKHSRIHSGLKPYKCNICGTSFTHNVSLKTHKKSTHGIDWWAENDIIKNLQTQLVDNNCKTD